jgi:mRNA interferase RelE/StbE
MVSKKIESIKWCFSFSNEARNEFKQLDQAIQKRIKKKVHKILEDNSNPALFFKRLTGNMSHLYSLRIGTYRLICEINGSQYVILAVHIGHRKDVYLD